MKELPVTVAEAYPELIREWIKPVMPRHQDMRPDNTNVNSCIRVRWQCSKKAEHTWEATVSSRCRGRGGCPECRGRQAHVPTEKLRTGHKFHKTVGGLTEYELVMLSQRLAEGGSAPELADTYHISLSSLYKWAANEGISYNRDQTKLTDEDKDDLIKHYLEGAEVERVIEEYEHLGFSRDVIGGFWELLAADDDLGDSDSNAQ